MFRLKITTNTERRSGVFTPVNMTIADAISRNEVSTKGATVSLNGRTLDPAYDFGKTFEDFGIQDNPDTEAIMSVIVKADSAAF